ncbi:MAG: hypothetical protein CBE35_00130 [Candidatus Pelagibacter sp. TMED275]|nr:MAG: hypothetical protein CBE35_00130 [Candidatus Pelagibacter sp. TMED275]
MTKELIEIISGAESL